MYHKNWTAQEQNCYRTGFTQQKKPKRGPLSVLLVLIIFFSGLNTAFRLLNIRLFREITQDAAVAPASVQFSAGGRSAKCAPGLPSLGLTGKAISDFEQQCYEIPSGFYITAVEPGSSAEKAGILPGDILLSFGFGLRHCHTLGGWITYYLQTRAHRSSWQAILYLQISFYED